MRITIPVRVDDLDTNGHVRGPAYLLYADNARWRLVQAAGVDLAQLRDQALGPVNLRTTIEFRHELRPDDTVEVETEFHWTTGRTSRVTQRLWTAGGVLAAEVESVSGLLDLTTRRLVDDPGGRWRALMADPALLGL
ncbi:acyl-CoA thioesterase [Actinocrispum wychmicini]|uniref:Acyl-CoA thioester hydrolase n=1 Tax=Actinocrispum wychmicini TaxID=1213861 RepID=A0A4R2IYD5_9PSEU|nr:acyl-CoA thioesterase [Actinocrispum wychmicini]TCO48939.1 acyl-CoA thioester hydrolase [Actinocrispum wychmicini]